VSPITKKIIPESKLILSKAMSGKLFIIGILKSVMAAYIGFIANAYFNQTFDTIEIG